jgi:hypothetical protein
LHTDRAIEVVLRVLHVGTINRWMDALDKIFDLYGTLVDWVKSISIFIEKFVSSEAVEKLL